MMSSEKREASPEASPLKGPAPKAVPEDTSDVVFEDGIPLSPMAADPSVQFISGTPANGDAKVEIGESGTTAPTFVGLGKEELMKYANDPFWVKLRWFLFILFWVLWIAMLVGAIVIIVLAPRCAEKTTTAETYYQMKASDLVKDDKLDDNTQKLKDSGVKAIIISETLQHDPGNAEAVTDFEKIDESIKHGLLLSAIEKLKSHGIKILLQIVPNHSGTSHVWFNETGDNSKYVREPFDKVKTSVWTMTGADRNAWTENLRPGFEGTAYLQQFPGNVADLNFRNEDVIDAFKSIVGSWKGRGIDGFSIGKASYLIEDLDKLMVRNATINQPENVKVLSRIFGSSSLVELDKASDETIKEYIAKGMTPVLTSMDVSTAEKIQESLETLKNNPEAILSLSKQAQPPEKSQLLSLLISAGGSHSLVNYDDNVHEEASAFSKKLLEFQEKNPKGKEVSLRYATSNEIVAILRSESDGVEHLILANTGYSPNNVSPSVFNITEPAKGQVVLSTPNANQKIGSTTEGEIQLNRLSGVVIKLEKKAEGA